MTVVTVINALLREGHMHPGNMARGVQANILIIGFSSGRSRRSKGSMAFWRSSLGDITSGLKDRKVLRA